MRPNYNEVPFLYLHLDLCSPQTPPPPTSANALLTVSFKQNCYEREGEVKMTINRVKTLTRYWNSRRPAVLTSFHWSIYAIPSMNLAVASRVCFHRRFPSKREKTVVDSPPSPFVVEELDESATRWWDWKSFVAGFVAWKGSWPKLWWWPGHCFVVGSAETRWSPTSQLRGPWNTLRLKKGTKTPARDRSGFPGLALKRNGPRIGSQRVYKNINWPNCNLFGVHPTARSYFT